MTAGRTYIQARDAGRLVPAPTADALFYCVTDPDGTEAGGVTELSELAVAIASQLSISSSASWVTITGHTFTAGTAPSAPLVEGYTLGRVGKLVNVHFNLAYDTAGATVTQLTIPWQAGWPAPLLPTAVDAANEIFLGNYGTVGSSGDLAPTSFTAGVVVGRRNAVNNQNELVMLFSSGTRSSFTGQFSYIAA